MGKIVRYLLNNPLVVHLTVFTVLLIGVNNAAKMRKEAFPEISMNKIFIQTVYPGSSAKDVELNVTVPLEESLSEVESIDEMTSISSEGLSLISIDADEDANASGFDKILDKVDDAVRGTKDLPAEIDGRPVITTFTSKDIPIMEIAITGDEDRLKKYVPFLEKELRKADGVSYVNTIGLPDDELNILVDAARAREYSVGLGMVATAVKKRNVQGSGGTLESFMAEKKVVSYHKYKDHADILNTFLRVSDLGYDVQLKDIASVSIAPKNMGLTVRNNGKPGVMMYLKKEGKADVLKTSENIQAVFQKLKVPDGVSYKVLNDGSRLTRDRLKMIVSNSALGFFLVVLILYVVFNAHTAFWVAFGIPFTLFASLIILFAVDISLNLISLGGFIIVLGMLVDDAIVVAEEINTNLENGKSPEQSAVDAVKVMWKPILGASTTTMVAFSPAMYLGGFPGKFVWIIPLMVVITLAISVLESYFILPIHLAHRKEKADANQEKFPQRKKFIIFLENKYRISLKQVLKHRYIYLGIFAGVFLLAILSMKFFIKQDAFPQGAAESFNIQITYPEGFSKEKTTEELTKIETILNSIPKKELIGYSSRIGTLNESSVTERGTQDNLAVLFVYLTPYSERTRTAYKIMDEVRRQMDPLLASHKSAYSINLVRLGPPMGKDLEIRISGKDEAAMTKRVEEMKQYLRTVKGIKDVSDNTIAGKKELNVEINYKLLATVGLTVEDVLTTLRIAYDGMIVTSINLPENTLDFRLRLNETGRANENYIKTLPIVNQYGQLINLGDIIRLRESEASGEIHHIERERAISIYLNLDLSILPHKNAYELVRKKFTSDQNTTVSYAGMPVETAKIFRDLGAAGITALIGIFVIISLIFNSYKKTFIIIFVIPFSLIGIVFALVTHGLPMSTLAGVSMLGLMGVVVNDGIVMVDTITRMAQDGDIFIGGIVEGAVSRLRPVLLTSLTTIFGLLPTGYGIGGYDPMLSDMCLVMAYGLAAGTMITMFLIPIYYMIGMDIRKVMANIMLPGFLRRG